MVHVRVDRKTKVKVPNATSVKAMRAADKRKGNALHPPRPCSKT